MSRVSSRSSISSTSAPWCTSASRSSFSSTRTREQRMPILMRYSPQSSSSGGASVNLIGFTVSTSSSAPHSAHWTTSPCSTSAATCTLASHSGHIRFLLNAGPAAAADQLNQRARLDDLQSHAGRRLSLEGALTHVNRATQYIHRDLVAVLHRVVQLDAADHRQPDVHRVAVEDTGETLRDHDGHAVLLDRERRVLARA